MDGFLPPVDQASWLDYQRKRAQRFASERIAAAGSGAGDWVGRATQTVDALVPDWAQPQPDQQPAIPQTISYQQPEPDLMGPPTPAASSLAVRGAVQQGQDWAQGALARIGAIGSDIGGTIGQRIDQAQGILPGGAAWNADLERIRREREAVEQQFPTPEPTGPAGFTMPETGTPEGERITGELAKTAMEQTPGGAFITDAARLASRARGFDPDLPMTAETPVQNVLQTGMGAAGATGLVSGLAQEGARQVMQRIPGGETSVFEGAPLPGGNRLRTDTPVLGGATTPDELIPFLVGMKSNDPEDVTRLLNRGRGVIGAVDEAVPRGMDDLIRAYAQSGADPNLGLRTRQLPREELEAVGGQGRWTKKNFDPDKTPPATTSRPGRSPDNGFKPGPGPSGEYVIEMPGGRTIVAAPPAPRTWLTADGYKFWSRVTSGQKPYAANWQETLRSLTKPRYWWDALMNPPEGAAGELPGAMDLAARPAVDWDTVLGKSGTPYAATRGTDPTTLRHLLDRYASGERMANEAVADLVPSHPDLATPQQQKAALADLKDALNEAGYPYKRTGSEDKAIQSERNVRGTKSYAYTPKKANEGQPVYFDSAYEVATAIKLDADPNVASWQKGAGPRGRVRVGIDPEMGYDPTNPARMDNSDPNPGAEVIYSPDFLVTYKDGSQRVIEVKNLGIFDLPAWRIAVKSDAGKRHFEEKWGVGFSMWAEDQIGRDFMRQLGTADVSKLPAGHALRRVEAGQLARLQKDLRSGAKGSRTGMSAPRLEVHAQHLDELNRSSRYPQGMEADAAADLPGFMGPARAQAEWHNQAGVDGSTFSFNETDVPIAPGAGGFMVGIAPDRQVVYPGHDVSDWHLAQFRLENSRIFDAYPEARVGTQKITANMGGKQVPATVIDVSIRVPDGQSAAEAANLFRQKNVYNIDTGVNLPVRQKNWAKQGAYTPEQSYEYLDRIIADGNARNDAGRGVRDFADYAGFSGAIPTPAAAVRNRAAAGRRGARAGLVGAADEPAGGVGGLARAGDVQPGAGAAGAGVPGGLAPDGRGSAALGEPGSAGIVAQPGRGDATGPGGAAGLAARLRDSTGALLPAGAASTPGEQAFDIGAGVVGGLAGAATADDDATWQERAQRFALGAGATALVGPTARAGLRTRGGRDVLGIAAGAAQGQGQGSTTPGGLTKLGAATQLGQALPLAAPPSLLWNAIGGIARTGQRFLTDSAGNLDRSGGSVADLIGMGMALPDAVRAFKGEVGGLSAQAARAQGVMSGGLASSANPWLKGLTIGTRVNAGTDQFFRVLNEGGARARAAAYGEDAAAAAKKAGDFATFVGPNSPVADALVTAGKWANDPNAHLAKRLFGATVASFAPYVRTPERILAAGVQLATDPASQSVAFLRALKRGDKAAMREAGGRVAVGTAVLALFAHDYLAGELRGSPPQNPTERRRQEAQGARWDTWRGVPVQKLGPLGTAASAVATSMAAGERAMLRGEHPTDMGRDVVNAVGRWALSNSYLDDLQRFSGDVAGGRAAQALERQAVSTVTRPLSAATGIGRAIDPVERAREGAGEELLYNLPGGRFLLPERIDPTTGDAVRRRGSGIERYVFGSQGNEMSPEGEELARYGINAPEYRAGEEYAGVAQTGAQARALTRASGSEVNREVRATIASPEYRAAADDEERTKLLRAAMTRARGEADIAVGSQAARDPERQAKNEYAAVPRYRGVKGTPDEIRRRNAQISRAKSGLAEAKKKGGTAERDWIRAHPDEYKLTRYDPVDPDVLRRARDRIEKQYPGVDLG